MVIADLRGILSYVPQFRGRTFVVAIDGAVLSSLAFQQLLVDLAMLQSLEIRVVLVYGAAAQVAAEVKSRGIMGTNTDGTGPVDRQTMDASRAAIAMLGSELMAGLTTVGVRASSSNAVSVKPAGIVAGIDQQFLGRIDKVDTRALEVSLDEGIMPVISPMGFSMHSGEALRMNSDAVAQAVARALGSDKIVFLAEEPIAVELDRDDQQVSVELSIEVANHLQAAGRSVNLTSKFRHAANACQDGVARVHIIDGRDPDALLNELFSHEGVGVMVHADAYQGIRPAQTKDIPELQILIHSAIEEGDLLPRSQEELEAQISNFRVFEIDAALLGCVAFSKLDGDIWEIGCLLVNSGHEGIGHGRMLVEYVEHVAIRGGAKTIFALSTKVPEFFERLGYSRVEPAELPKIRREQREVSGRNSVVLRKVIGNSD